MLNCIIAEKNRDVNAAISRMGRIGTMGKLFVYLLTSLYQSGTIASMHTLSLISSQRGWMIHRNRNRNNGGASKVVVPAMKMTMA